jgi:spore germination protein KC
VDKFKKIKARTWVLLMLFLTSGVFGCSSAYEPNEISLVQVIGIDRGQENLLKVSFLIAIPQNLAGDNAKGGEGSFLVTISAPSIFQAERLANTFVGRKLSLIHAKGIIFSDKAAKEGLIEDLLPSLLQYREARGTAFVAITENDPAKLLEKFVPLLEANPSRYMELLTQNFGFTGLSSSTQLQDVYNALKLFGTDSVVTLINLSPEKLPEGDEEGNFRVGGLYKAGSLPKKGGVEIEAMGGAIIKDGKMIDTLNGVELTSYNMVTGNFRSSTFSFPDPQQKDAIINLEVFYARQPQIETKMTEEGVVIDLVLRLEGNVLGGGTTTDYALMQNRVRLEKHFAEITKRQIELLVEKSQKLESDFLDFGIKAKRIKRKPNARE